MPASGSSAAVMHISSSVQSPIVRTRSSCRPSELESERADGSDAVSDASPLPPASSRLASAPALSAHAQVAARLSRSIRASASALASAID
eukprot:354049-Pleurochrysis_carterae.AAC.1